MAAIEIGLFNFDNVVTGDMLDVTIDIAGIDLTGKTLKCQWRESYDTAAVVELKESDGSLIKTVVSSILTTARFVKNSTAMKIPMGIYKHKIIMYTTSEDVQTIAEGTAEVVFQITLLS